MNHDINLYHACSTFQLLICARWPLSPFLGVGPSCEESGPSFFSEPYKVFVGYFFYYCVAYSHNCLCLDMEGMEHVEKYENWSTKRMAKHLDLKNKDS